MSKTGTMASAVVAKSRNPVIRMKSAIDPSRYARRRVVLGFMTAHHAVPRTCILLNGLPRHIGQATAMEAVLEIRAVIHLRCSPETVFARIDADTGGDRAGRVDDDLEAVAEKLAIFPSFFT